MTEEPAFTTPAPMEGHGGYNRGSRVQAAGLSPAVPLLERAARTAALADPPVAVAIADYGCSEGHNSRLPLAAAIRVLRGRIGAGDLGDPHRRGRERLHRAVRDAGRRPGQLCAG